MPHLFLDLSLVAWLALFPLTYLVHIAEEYWGGGGYSDYLRRNYSVQLSPQRFLSLQGLGISLMVIGVVLAVVLRFPLTMLGILSAIVLGNALIHIIRSARDRAYTPGLITAIALWLPLGTISLRAVGPSISATRLTLALLAGVAANCVVEFITFRGNVLKVSKSS